MYIYIYREREISYTHVLLLLSYYYIISYYIIRVRQVDPSQQTPEPGASALGATMRGLLSGARERSGTCRLPCSFAMQ